MDDGRNQPEFNKKIKDEEEEVPLYIRRRKKDEQLMALEVSFSICTKHSSVNVY